MARQPGAITTGTTLLQAISEAVSPDTLVTYQPAGEFADSSIADAGIVVVGEPPYCEGEGDRDDLSLSAADLARAGVNGTPGGGPPRPGRRAGRAIGHCVGRGEDSTLLAPKV